MKTALVLGGGGAKGAYEIGVWEALRELDVKVDIVAGTSIGALIGTMYVQDDYEKARDLWDHLQVSDVIRDGVSLDMDMDMIMSQKSQFKQMFSSMISNHGADISPFVQMIDTMFDADKFFSSDKDFGCMCVKVKGILPAAFLKRDMNADNAKDYILASASCFPAFPMKTINGENYVDGGYYDNVPVKLARSMGADRIIAVDLKAPGKRQIHIPQDDLLYIEPFVPLGSFLDFTHEQLQRNMRLGYLDAMKKFHQYYGYVYTFTLESRDDILAFEKHFHQYVKESHTSFRQPLINQAYQQLLHHTIKGTIKNYELYRFRYLRILELCGYLFDMDMQHIYTFKEFCNKLLDIFHHSDYHLYPQMGKIRAVKEIAKDIRSFSRRDIVNYLYQRMVDALDSDRSDMNYLSIVFREEFTIALTIFILDHIYRMHPDDYH